MADLESPPRTPSSSRKKRKTRSESPYEPSSSPRKSPKKASSSSKPESVPRSQWRASRVPKDQKILKGECRSKYRLKDKDFQGLAYTKQLTKAGHTMMLYSERDVEQVAWVIHGGPDAFEAYIEKLRATHLKRASKAAKQEPNANHPRVTPVDAFEQRLLQKAQGHDWLWFQCLVASDPDEYNFEGLPPAVWDRALTAAVQGLPDYPRRIPAPTTISPTFQALRTALAQAPKMGTKGPDVLCQTYNYPDMGESYYWSPSYFTRIFQALIDIIEAHGTGDEGWGSARWIVYDKYSEHWGGISIPATWEPGEYEKRTFTARDSAYGWLQTRLPVNKKPRLDFALYDEDNHPPAIWQRYNALLPEEP